MGGQLPGKNSTMLNDDNFHQSSGCDHRQRRKIDHDCDASDTPCVLKTLTVSENIYGNLDALDTGYYPIAASEMKTKISSR